jgi:hypothetical protein
MQCKLIKDERENKLMIEGRPKLSVSKVSPKADHSSPSSVKNKMKDGESSSGGLKRKNSDSGNKDWPKIRIKLGPAGPGVSPIGGGSNSSGGGQSGKEAVTSGGKPAMSGANRKPDDDNGPYTFSFAGKPTYSPSRVEPSQTVQEKGT